MTDELHIGFTGTRHGMTEGQLAAVAALFERMAKAGRVIARHGMCIGGDGQFHRICRRWPDVWIVGHPGPDDDLTRRAGCDVDEINPGKPHHARNRDIVVGSRIMIAAPREMAEHRFGGTWSTVRCARRMQRPLALVLSDGSITRERWSWRRA